jgi:hypothetical protein
MVDYNLNIPSSGADPSTEQPDMTINTNAIADIWSVDHVGFNVSSATPGGTHLKNSFYSQQSPTLGTALAILFPGARPGSGPNPLYLNATGSNATNTYLMNAAGTFPTSMIKAGGTFTTTASSGAISFNSQFNCSSISQQAQAAPNASLGTGLYTITFPTGVIVGSPGPCNAIVLISAQSTTTPSGPTLVPSYVVSTGQLQIGWQTVNTVISFLVLQV